MSVFQWLFQIDKEVFGLSLTSNCSVETSSLNIHVNTTERNTKARMYLYNKALKRHYAKADFYNFNFMVFALQNLNMTFVSFESWTIYAFKAVVGNKTKG